MPKKTRAVTGFRLDPETLSLFRARLRERGMSMQPTLEAWVKRWLETGEPFPPSLAGEIRKDHQELRKLLESLRPEQ